MFYPIMSVNEGFVVVVSDDPRDAEQNGLHMTQAEELIYTLGLSPNWYMEILDLDDHVMVGRIHCIRAVGMEVDVSVRDSIKECLNEKDFRYLDKEDLSKIFDGPFGG